MPLPAVTAPTGLRARIAAFTPRERGFLAAGAVTVLAFLIYLAWPSSDEAEVELATSPPAPAQPAFVPPPAAPAPMSVVAAPAPADPAAAASLVLRGVMGGGPSGGAAIVGSADGSQRVVRVGRELAPGITLRQVGVNYAIATTLGGDLRLELNKPGATPVPLAGQTVATPAPALQGTPSVRRETTEFRLGLQPMRRNGRISSYALKPGAIPARLQQAGLRAGDVILRVNGSELNEERLAELSWELSNAERTEFEILRNGQPMKVQFQGR